jgi:membrane protease YdiL (CAAX protease family)
VIEPGWYPDPGRQSRLRFWNGRGWTADVYPVTAGSQPTIPALERAAYDMFTADPRPWGWRPVAVPIVALVLLISAGAVASATVNPGSYDGDVVFTIVANGLLEILLGAAVWFAGKDIAARYGGWGPAFGWRSPQWSDLGLAAAGIGVAFVGRAIVEGVADGLTHGRAVRQAQNVQLHQVTAASVTLLVILTVICAPLTEELVFRGLLLRSFMRRLRFWPSALISTAIFALFHTYEVDTVSGASTLAASVACLGIVNCYLNRRSDRLGPGIMVHATLNLLAVIALVVQAGS